MNLNTRRRLVRRLDVLMLLGLLLTSGTAALFFSTRFYANEEQITPQTGTSTVTATSSPTRSITPTHTPSLTDTPTATPLPRATATLTLSATPWPAPTVTVPSSVYVGQSAVLTGYARPHDTIHVYDAQQHWIGGTLADAEGRWAVSLPPNMVVGMRQLQVVAVGAQGAVSAPVEVSLSVLAVPSATPTRSPTPTYTASATLPATATLTPNATFTISHTPTSTATATFTATRTPSATTTPSPSPTWTVTLTSTATLTPTASATPSATRLAAVAQAASPTSAPTAMPSVSPTPTATRGALDERLHAPHIDDPPSGAVYSPGALTLRGRAAAGVQVLVLDAHTGAVLGQGLADSSGLWAVTVTLSGEGARDLVAAVTVDGTRYISDAVRITLAPPLQPATGGVLTSTDPEASGRAFTALLALLLVAGGFSVFFAGRLVYLVTRGRKRFS